MDEARDEHAEARETIARIQKMDATDKDYDSTVKELSKLIDQHVLEEREQIFLEARHAALDLREITVALFERKQQLKRKASAPAKEAA